MIRVRFGCVIDHFMVKTETIKVLPKTLRSYWSTHQSKTSKLISKVAQLWSACMFEAGLFGPWKCRATEVGVISNHVQNGASPVMILRACSVDNSDYKNTMPLLVLGRNTI